MTITLYHNPRCSKSRKTLLLIEQQGFTPKIIEYLKTPPDFKTLESIVKLLDINPRDLIRKKEVKYAELGLDDTGKSDTELILAMVTHPILIERPIVVANNKAAIGRPPEQVLEIL